MRDAGLKVVWPFSSPSNFVTRRRSVLPDLTMTFVANGAFMPDLPQSIRSDAFLLISTAGEKDGPHYTMQRNLEPLKLIQVERMQLQYGPSWIIGALRI